ncbi:MAG TPA: alpha/beta hydrolase [Kofleriaceae bacterium]
MIRWTEEAGMIVRRWGEGPELVWIHGLGESSTSFDPIARAMPGFTHVLPDLPGYGRSMWPDAPVTLEALAAHLAGWLKAPARIVGHSMGGVLAVLLAELGAAAAIVNVDGNISIGDCNFSGAAAAYSPADFAAHGFAALRDKVYRDGVADAPLRGYAAAMHFAAPHVFHGHALDLVRLSSGQSLAGRIAALRTPALYVAGVPRGICEASRALLTSAGVPWVGLSPAGHWVYLDQLAAFADLVSRFFGMLPA